MEQVFTFRIRRDGEWFIGHCDEVPEATSQGLTLQSCTGGLTQAVALVLDEAAGVVKTCSEVDVQTVTGTQRFAVELTRSHEGYAIGVPSLSGCWSQGDTEAEAKENIADAIRDYLEVQAELAHKHLHKVA